MRIHRACSRASGSTAARLEPLVAPDSRRGRRNLTLLTSLLGEMPTRTAKIFFWGRTHAGSSCHHLLHGNPEIAISTEAIPTAKGQTTIPKPIRDGLGIKAGDRMIFTLMRDGVVLMRVKNKLVSTWQDFCIRRAGRPCPSRIRLSRSLFRPKSKVPAPRPAQSVATAGQINRAGTAAPQDRRASKYPVRSKRSLLQ
jgi:antitoxin PrlF